jgi:uncharacterized protein (TIGR02246 family)
MSDNDEAVRETLARTVTAWTANDAGAFAGRYAPAATVMLASGVFLQGRDEIAAYMTAGFAGPLKGTRGIDEAETVRLLGDDTAVVVSRSGFAQPGDEAVMRRATWVLSRHDDGWAVEAYANTPIAN